MWFTQAYAQCLHAQQRIGSSQEVSLLQQCIPELQDAVLYYIMQCHHDDTLDRLSCGIQLLCAKQIIVLLLHCAVA